MERKTNRGKESVCGHLKKRENNFDEVKSYNKVRKMHE